MSSVAVGRIAEELGRSKRERGTARLAVALERTMSEGPYRVVQSGSYWAVYGPDNKPFSWHSQPDDAGRAVGHCNAAFAAGAAGKAELVEACKMAEERLSGLGSYLATAAFSRERDVLFAIRSALEKAK